MVSICVLSHIVSNMGEKLVLQINQAIDNNAFNNSNQDCPIEIDSDYDEVYKLSTYILREMYLNYRASIADDHKMNVVQEERSTDNQEERQQEDNIQIEESSLIRISLSTIDVSDQSPEIDMIKKKDRSLRSWWLYPVFRQYLILHNVSTPRVFWLHTKKNFVLFMYEVIYFFNHNMPVVMRLFNIGLMTVACGIDNVIALVNLLLLILMVFFLNSYDATPAVAVILTALLFIEYGLYIVPNKTVFAEWLGMNELSHQVRNYLVVANVSSSYMVPNTLALFSLVIQMHLTSDSRYMKDIPNNQWSGQASSSLSSESEYESDEWSVSEEDDEISNSSEEEELQEMEMTDLENMGGENIDMETDDLGYTFSPHSAENTLMKAICRWIIYQLHNITLIVIFLVSVTNPSLLSSVYLVFSLYYLFNPEPIKRLDSKEVQFIKFYAFIHLALMVLYQLPLFPEPSECQLNGTCVPIMRLIGLNKMVYSSYIGNPTCSLYDEIADIGRTECPGPYQLEGGILNIVIINIVVNILVSVIIYLTNVNKSYYCFLLIYSAWLNFSLRMPSSRNNQSILKSLL